MERFGLALGSFLGALPLYIVWLAGFVLSLVHWKEKPRISLLTLIATAGALVSSLVYRFAQARLLLGLSSGRRANAFSILNVSQALVSAVWWALLLIALFDSVARQVPAAEAEKGAQGGVNAKRLSRGGYWIRWAITFPVGVVASLLTRSESTPLIVVAVAVSLAISIYMIIQGVRRMHDVDRSGWFILVPVYNLVLALTAGTPGGNRYGENPKRRGGSDG